MRFEFDENKSRKNKAERGVDFAEAQAMWERPTLEVPAKDVKGEKRWVVLGRLHGEIYQAVITYRGDSVRIISVSRTKGRLRRLYEQVES